MTDTMTTLIPEDTREDAVLATAALDELDELEELRAGIRGRVTTPFDAEWDAARTPWALAVDQRPALVIHPADAADVRTAVRFAARHGLRVAPQGTGHNAYPLGDLSDTILLRTDLMRGVEIEAERQSARVEAGVVWQEVVDAAAVHGLAALAGSSADVGVVGYTLGGGVSWLARSHGLSANSVIAAELVTGDGELRRVDDAHDPELFWALRGGGGAFGVVTALEIRLFPLTEVYAGALFWPLERAEDVLHAWRAWTGDLPASVMSAARVMRFPALPQVPEPMRGRAFVVIDAVLQEEPTIADALLTPLRHLEPVMDTFTTTPIPQLSALHMDPPGPTPGLGDGTLLRTLDPETIDAFVRVASGRDELLVAELRVLGGALAPSAAGRREGGVVSGLDGRYLLFTGGLVLDAESAQAVRSAVDELLDAVAPWRSDRDYLNFAEAAVPARRLFGDALPRLGEIKQRVDPRNLVRSNHPLGR
ncbi:FAD-binding oxidoreductase [Microbacterium sp.]|uniref:FAD-binding oxidoreductase n=1 Tax=Microbacterium sp. TaxID=51671 RepID=UPI003C767EE9